MSAGNQPESRQETLRRFIERTGAKCPACGYDLRGIAATRCPECGAELELGALMAADATFRKRPRRVMWAAGVLWLGFGVVAGLMPPRAGAGGTRLVAFFGAIAATLAAAALLEIDRSIFNDRIRDARASTVPSFGVAVNVWCVLMTAAGAAMAAWVVWLRV